MSDKEQKTKWLKVTKHDGSVHTNPLNKHNKTFLEKQNAVLPLAKKMKIEEVEMTAEEARALKPYDENHVPPTQDEVQAFIAEINDKDEQLKQKEAELEELRKQLADKKAGGAKKNSGTV